MNFGAWIGPICVPTAAWAKPRWVGKKTGPNPTDRAKRGVKRSVLTEAHGIPLGVAVDAANRNDHLLLEHTLESVVVKRPRIRSGLCLDKGYDFESIVQLAKRERLELHLRRRGEKPRRCPRGKRSRRWVVERTHSWLHRFRAILTRWNKKADNYLGLLHLACAVIVMNRMGLFG